jgi:hypothetical protein
MGAAPGETEQPTERRSCRHGRGRQFGGCRRKCSSEEDRSSLKKKCRKERPRATCVSSDVNLADGSVQLAGRIVKKVWLMRNSSDDAEWGDGVELVFIKGNECLAFEPRFSVRNAAPGEIVQVDALIQVPDKEGRYSAYFRLKKNGNCFGPKVWVDITSCADVAKCSPIQTEQELQAAVARALDEFEAKLAMKRGKKAKKELKKAEKLKARRAKVAEKMARLDAKLEELESSTSAVAVPVIEPSAPRVEIEEVESTEENGEEDGDDHDDDDSESPVWIEQEVCDDKALVQEGPAVVPEPVVQKPEPEAEEQPEESFVYADQLTQILSRGFGDEEVVKSLLVKYDGDVSQVIQFLLR